MDATVVEKRERTWAFMALDFGWGFWGPLGFKVLGWVFGV